MAEPQTRRPTLRDVAIASGVSRATVGFVLNDDPSQTISSTTAARVRAAAAELGYVPHGIARALREGSSRVVLLDAAGMVPGEPFRAYVHGLRAELEAFGLVLLIRPAGADELESSVLDVLRPKALLRVGAGYDGNDDESDGGWTDGLAAHSVEQLRYLSSVGHREIAVMVPEGREPFSTLRARFAHEAALRLGLQPPLVVRIPDGRDGVTGVLSDLRVAYPDVTAVAAFDDEIALRVLGAAADLELRVPDDLALIGFGDGGLGPYSVPPLTSVRIDAENYGRRAARIVAGEADLGPPPDPATVVVRESA